MTKAATAKKLKKVPTTESDISEYDPSIFEIRDRHYGSLLAVKKKIRACEKKIRELEQSASPPSRIHPETNSLLKKGSASQIDSEEANNERLAKLEHKKTRLSIWKEAAVCIHSARKDEMAQGITNVSMADVVDGIDLLKQVLANDDKWPHYKCPNKKHLLKVDIERIRQLAHYLNIQATPTRVGSSSSSHLNSFTSVVDYLSSPIAIGQECPMSFPEFVRLFDKLKRTLTVEIVVKEPVLEPVIITVASPENNDVEVSTKSVEAAAGVVASGEQLDGSKRNKNRTKRSPKVPKSGRKSQNGASPLNITQNNNKKANTASTAHSSLPSIPEKLVVVVTNNAKNKNNDGLSASTSMTPPIASVEDMSKSDANVAPISDTNVGRNIDSHHEVPSGRFIHNPNVPTDDSDEEGWLVPATAKKTKPVVESQSYRPSSNGSKRGGNGPLKRDRGGLRNGTPRGGNGNNSRRGPNPRRNNNEDANDSSNFRNKRPQHMNKSSAATMIQGESQY